MVVFYKVFRDLDVPLSIFRSVCNLKFVTHGADCSLAMAAMLGHHQLSKAPVATAATVHVLSNTSDWDLSTQIYEIVFTDVHQLVLINTGPLQFILVRFSVYFSRFTHDQNNNYTSTKKV